MIRNIYGTDLFDFHSNTLFFYLLINKIIFSIFSDERGKRSAKFLKYLNADDRRGI